MPVSEPSDRQGLMMVIFEDMAPQEPAKPAGSGSEPTEKNSQRIAELEHELRSTREYLQTTVEELETANPKPKIPS